MMAEEPNGFLNPGLPEKPQALDAVLVAEDDPVFRHVLEYWLKKWDYRVTSVENGLDAWNILQKVDSPQMAILDWMMPAMDGVELCRRLRQHEGQRYHFVLLVTSKDDKQDVVAGLSAGADDYLTKPFNVDELRARIRTGERILHLQDALIRAHEALRFESAHDPLTGLWNRGAILELLEREVQLHQRTGSALGLMMVDLDRFKQVNDTQGHLVGDVVLRETAHRMAASVRNYDWVGRYGGEEFLIVVPGCDADALLVSAERLRAAVAEPPVETTAGPVPITLSIGIVSAMPPGPSAASFEKLLYAADTALYKAKANGRNRVEVAGVSRAAGQQ
jgi:two-component system, cell cycle response regulator